MPRPRLTWKRAEHPPYSSLSREERGYKLNYGGSCIEHVSYQQSGCYAHPWYFYGCGTNSLNLVPPQTWPTIEEARAACLAHCKKHLEGKEG